jgi:hypothetical protein
MAQSKLEKDQWFLEQFQKGRIEFDGEFFFSPKTGNVFNSINSRGYNQISLLRNDETGRKVLTLMSHRLIWIIHYGLITDSSLVINHIDGNKLNNSISNLELVSVTKNLRHALNTGLLVMPQAEEKVNSVFTNQQVREFRKMFFACEITQKAISEIVGCNKSTVQYMLVGKTYKSVV